MLTDYFKEQIEQYQPITEDIYEKIEYKRVWSGEMMQVGDKVLYALVIPKDETEPKLMQVLERELSSLNEVFAFDGFEKGTIPVLKFK